MNSKSWFIVFYLFLLLVILACSPALYIPTLADSQKAGISADSLAIGRKIYVNNCSSCHSLYRPDHFTKGEWAKVMPVMQKKARIDNEQRMMIIKYLSVHYKEGQ
jgi:nitrate/TMAO reductase-like tetraheme cytochrome c subunit